MEQREVKAIVAILRDVTRCVKVYPFIYAALYIVCILCYYFDDEGFSTLIDTLFYVAPIVIVMMIRLSYALRLCIWHRLQCSLPLLPTSIGLFDTYVYELSSVVEYVNIASITTLFLLSLVNAYFTFIKPKQQ